MEKLSCMIHVDNLIYQMLDFYKIESIESRKNYEVFPRHVLSWV